MTHTASLALRARPSVMVAAQIALNSSPHAAIADPKATAVPPRDLSGTYVSLGLDDHPNAVCVLVPKVEIDDKAALRILTGSTMNGRYIDDATANKLLADDGNKAGLGKGVSISHHHEPRRVAGKPCNRGEHVAIH